MISRLDVETWKESCRGSNWKSETVDIRMFVDVYQMECIWGLFGILTSATDDQRDCEWIRYPLSKEWFNLPLMKDYNKEGEYVEYSCQQNTGK